MSLTHSKLLHLLRCTPCTGHLLLENFDDTMREGLNQILNLRLSDSQWVQAMPPIRDGGLGIRRVSALAPSAFLASAASTRDLQSAILLKTSLPTDPRETEIIAQWRVMSQMDNPGSGPLHKQSTWDRPLILREYNHLLQSDQRQYHQVRLRAVSSEHAGDWLYALPIASCGLRMDGEAVRIVVGLRLSANICEPHICPRGEQVLEVGSHGLSCSLGPGRVPCHTMINDVVYWVLLRAGIPSVKEPPDLSRSHGRRLDGLTLIPWHAGRSLIWDVTVADTVAATHLPITSLLAGAAEAAAVRKNNKYADLTTDYIFLPLAFESFGPVSLNAQLFIKQLGRCISESSGDKREGSFLFQHLSMAMQRFNAISFQGTFSVADLEEPDES